MNHWTTRRHFEQAKVDHKTRPPVQIDLLYGSYNVGLCHLCITEAMTGGQLVIYAQQEKLDFQIHTLKGTRHVIFKNA